MYEVSFSMVQGKILKPRRSYIEERQQSFYQRVPWKMIFYKIRFYKSEFRTNIADMSLEAHTSESNLFGIVSCQIPVNTRKSVHD